MSSKLPLVGFVTVVGVLVGFNFLGRFGLRSSAPQVEVVPYGEVVMFEAADAPVGVNPAYPTPPPAPAEIVASPPAPEPYFEPTTVEASGHPSAPSSSGTAVERILEDPKKFKLLLSGLLTLIVAPLSLFAVFGKGVANESRKWAYTTLGTLLGYWLS